MQYTPERSGRSVIVVTVVIVLTDVVTRRCHKLAPSVRPFSGILSVMAIFHHLRPSPIRVAAPITSELPTIHEVT